MSELNAGAADSFIEAVKNGADEAASAFSRTFESTITISPGTGGALDFDSFRQKVSGEGLALLLLISGKGVAILVPSSTGLVPGWCANPDITQKSKLATFSQEWGMNLLPEDFFPDDYKAGFLRNLDSGLLRSGLNAGGGFLEICLSKDGDSPVSAYIVWALDNPNALLDEPKAEEALNLPPPPMFGSDPVGGGKFIGNGAPEQDSPSFAARPKRHLLDDLPGYSRSVLKIKVPVAAVLATARKPIKSILELGVGSVIQFNKSCDELIEIEVGQCVVVGTAEAVKVGDKFGFRIHSIQLPDERFRKVEVRREGEYHVRQDKPQIIGKAPIKSLDG
ncbi:MAG: FliM/FliN family flagellar motor switch protein [Planctomycetaceae bacterium]|nr:FliM/FliN family flagellar motor switch protein [Planctomycetaceae bacterium]